MSKMTPRKKWIVYGATGAVGLTLFAGVAVASANAMDLRTVVGDVIPGGALTGTDSSVSDPTGLQNDVSSPTAVSTPSTASTASAPTAVSVASAASAASAPAPAPAPVPVPSAVSVPSVDSPPSTASAASVASAGSL